MKNEIIFEYIFTETITEYIFTLLRVYPYSFLFLFFILSAYFSGFIVVYMHFKKQEKAIDRAIKAGRRFYGD